ncbi:MAG: DUF2058 family protein [Steroidobacteraceae bacterium]
MPANIAENIRQCDQRAVVNLTADASQPDGDDPYKDYVVPDELRW